MSTIPPIARPRPPTPVGGGAGHWGSVRRASWPGLAVSVAGAMLLWALPAAAQTGCPPIRPAGLTAAQVDAVVLDRVATVLQMRAARVSLERSLAALDGSEAAPQLFAEASGLVAEALGIDAAGVFRRAAAARDPGLPPEVVLSVGELQQAAREAYLLDDEREPPAAVPGARYRLDGAEVGTPEPAAGWRLLRCTHDAVVFRRAGAADDEVATAIARMVSLPRWAGADALVQGLRERIGAALPAGHRLRAVHVERAVGGGERCADAFVLARNGDTPLRLVARLCQAAGEATHGHLLLFSQAGSDDVARFGGESAAFLRAAGAR